MSGMSETQVKTIGLTGTMGSGKSTVLSLLKERIPVIDCDSINRDLLLPGHAGYVALQKAGLLLTREDGTADTAAMSARMFSQDGAEYRKETETILQNLILEQMKAWMQDQNGLCAVEVPLLFELHLENLFDEVWSVTASEETALQRLENGRGISRKEALARLAHQSSPHEKIRKSTRVLVNDGTLEDLKQETLQCLQQAAAGLH